MDFVHDALADGRPFQVLTVVNHLHDYRNELQHHDHVRPESIRPAALVLFDIALDLMVNARARLDVLGR
jgi:hypothetical protein